MNLGHYERSTNFFSIKSKLLFGNKYDYSKVDLSYSEVIITCFKHGDFSIKPYDYLDGQGCPNCSYSKESE